MTNAGVNPNASSQQFGTYLDVTLDVKPWLQMKPTDTTMDANLSRIVKMACNWVQKYLGRPVARKQFDYRFDGWSGWSGTSIMLPWYPVLNVVSVTEYWGVSGPHNLVESTPTNQVDGWQCEWLTGRLVRVFPGNVQKPFFPGSRNVEVVWEAGYNPIPGDIEVATLEMIAHWFRNTQQQSALRPGLRMGDEAEPMETGPLWTGVPFRVIDLLEPYVQIGIG
jgi:hypothetical protein